MTKLSFYCLSLLAVPVLVAVNVASFHPTPMVCSLRRSNHLSRLSSSPSGKGFGTPPASPKPPKKNDAVESSPTPVDSVAPPATPLTAGQQSLSDMRRRKAEERDEQLRKVKDLLEMDRSVAEAPAAIPEKVAMRMGQRMLPFVGLPLFLGMGSFVAFWYLVTYKNLEFEPVTVAVSTIGILVVGLFGITYSIFSTSWDEDREGDMLGLEEAKRNLDNVRDGLGRSRENAIIRENMSGLSEAEIQRAIADLDKRDAKNKSSS